jgi:hypothetical protein
VPGSSRNPLYSVLDRHAGNSGETREERCWRITIRERSEADRECEERKQTDHLEDKQQP